jgi:cytochrome d ubiquinol oxidase subunit I
MKLAAAEALWESEQPASLSLLTIGDLSGTREVFSIRLPYVMSLLTCNNLDCEVRGMDDLQAEFEKAHGPGNYVPPIPISYWSFRAMMTAGLLMILLALLALYLVLKDKLDPVPKFLRLLLWAIPLPYLANTTGWILAEVGRQPWIVYELMLTQDGVSPGVATGTVLFSLLVFALLYGALMVADIYLLAKVVGKGVTAEAAAEMPSDEQPSALAAAQ